MEPGPIRMWEAHETEKKKDTGTRLKRAGELAELPKSATFAGVSLVPGASVTVSPADSEIVARQGVCALNCSWEGDLLSNNIRVSNITKKAKVPRCLPWLIATNGTKYGTPYTLSTAEAIGAVLAICGFESHAHRLLKHFRWADEFWRVNGEYIQLYQQCSNSAEVVRAQNDALARAREEQAQRKQQSIEEWMPPSDSSTSDNENNNHDHNDGDDDNTPMSPEIERVNGTLPAANAKNAADTGG